PGPPQELQRRRRPLGLLPAARLPAGSGMDGGPPEALCRRPHPSGDLPQLSPARGRRGARGAVIARVLRKGGARPMSQHTGSPRFLSQRELADYRRDGFLVCRGLFGPAEVAGLRHATDEVQGWPEQPGVWMVYGEKSLRESGQRLINRIENFYPYHPGFKALFDGDKLLGRVNDLFGEPAVLFKDKINFKLAGGDGFKPHQDQQAGWTVYASLFVTALVAIDDATEANGCLDLAAGHHTRGLIGAEWKPLADETLPGVEFHPYPH